MRRPGVWLIAAVCVVGFLLGAGLAGTYLLSRRATYEARVALLATPKQPPSQVNFGALVAFTMPGLTDVATSVTVRQSAISSVPELSGGTSFDGTVGLRAVPGSGLALITVTGPSASLTSSMAQGVGQAIINQDLLAPAGDFRLVDPSAPPSSRIEPDRYIVGALSIVAGLVTATGAVLLLGLLRPRLISARQVVRVIDDPAVAVVDQGDGIVDMLAGPSHRALVADRLTLVPAGSIGDATLQSFAGSVGQALTPSVDRAVAAARGQHVPAAILVQLGRSRPQDLRTAIALVRGSRLSLLAVVVARK